MFVKGEGCLADRFGGLAAAVSSRFVRLGSFLFGTEEVCVGLGRFVRLGVGVWGSGSVQRRMQRLC